MKVQTINIACPLTGEAVDELAAQTETFLRALRMERSNILRVRLSLEETLLRWRERFGGTAEVRFSAGSRWRVPYTSWSSPAPPSTRWRAPRRRRRAGATLCSPPSA